MRRRPTRFRVAVGVAAVVGVSCSTNGTSATPGVAGFDRAASGTIAAQVASYEPVAAKGQRFLLGMVDDKGSIVGFGTIVMDFAFAGTAEAPIKAPIVTISHRATYRLVAGQPPAADDRGPRLIAPSDGLGVYGTTVTFDQAGYWNVRARTVIDNRAVEATATFEVLAKPLNPFPGDPAPRTDNRRYGTPGLPAKAIDSRASTDGSVPDPELHSTTIADAIAAGRAVMVVVSTPVYCVSRFCGPITDTVQQLAKTYGDRMAFVHIEVWNDFEKRALNKEAAEWIYRNGADPKEPWVFLIGRDGTIVQRWDNVSTDDELRTAVRSIAG